MWGGVQAGAWGAEEVDLAVLMGVGQLATAPAPPRVLLCGGSPEEPCAAPPPSAACARLSVAEQHAAVHACMCTMI